MATPCYVLTSRENSAPGTSWLSHPSQDHGHTVDQQHNHNQAGLGTRCCLATAAKGYLQTTLSCSGPCPAPEERLKSSCIYQHSPWERAAQSPSLPCLPTACSKAIFQTKAPPSTAAMISPEVPPSPWLPSHTPVPTTKRNKQHSPPKNSKTKTKGFPSRGSSSVAATGPLLQQSRSTKGNNAEQHLRGTEMLEAGNRDSSFPVSYSTGAKQFRVSVYFLLEEGNSFPRDVIKFQSHGMRKETGM